MQHPKAKMYSKGSESKGYSKGKDVFKKPNDLMSWRLAQSFGFVESGSGNGSGSGEHFGYAPAQPNLDACSASPAHQLQWASTAVQDVKLSQMLSIPREKRKEMLHLLVEALDNEEEEQMLRHAQLPKPHPQSHMACYQEYEAGVVPGQSQIQLSHQFQRVQPPSQPSRELNVAHQVAHQEKTMEELRGALQELLKSPQQLEESRNQGPPRGLTTTTSSSQHEQKTRAYEHSQTGKSERAPKKTDLLWKYHQYKGAITTLMIRNVPLRVTQQAMLQVFAENGFGDDYDFFYMPSGLNPDSVSGEASTDSGLESQSISTSNLGYAFINFPDTEKAMAFQLTFHNYKFESSGSNKLCAIYPAHIQGFENNVKHFRRTAVKLSTNKPFIRYANSMDGLSVNDWQATRGRSKPQGKLGQLSDASTSISDATSTSTLNYAFGATPDDMGFKPRPRKVVPPRKKGNQDLQAPSAFDIFDN